MRVAIIGSGPAGLMLGAALARRGHDVVSVDRDPGPAPDGSWHRRGVMQFEHAHAFRPQVRGLLESEWPQALAAWAAEGAEPVLVDVPGVGPVPMGTRSRRSTFERALRRAATDASGLTLHQGHVDALLDDGHVVTGMVVDGTPWEADLVVDASGRSGRVGAHGHALDGDCGIAYVDRVYRLVEGAQPGPMTNPVAWVANFDGWQNLLFLHERGYFSVLFVRPTADARLKDLRHQAAFEAACRAVPGLAAWTDAGRSAPASEVMVGGALRNVYRPQAGRPGLVAVGDSVSTTTPSFGRGVAMTAMQVRALLERLDDDPSPETLHERFGSWCDEQIRPWVEDHIASDADAVRRWHGEDTYVEGPLTSVQIMDAALADPDIGASVGPYVAMEALPGTLQAQAGRARAVYATGWRPPLTDGPTRDELVDVVQEALQPV